MKLKSFSISNYKSIKNSDLCWLASDITILAGKNESGKTAILEALRDFDAKVKIIPDESLPLEGSDDTEIELTFEIDNTTIEKIEKVIGVQITEASRDFLKSNGLQLLKKRNGSYNYYKDLADVLNKQKNEINRKHIASIQLAIKKIRQISELSAVAEPRLDSNIETIKAEIAKFILLINTKIPSIVDKGKQQEISQITGLITKETTSLQVEDVGSIFFNEAIKHIPNFIFFSDFSNILPFEIILAQAKNNAAIKDFAKVAGLDLDEVIRTTDTQRRMNILNKYSASISGDFKSSYNQDKVELIAVVDGDKLRIGVKEEGKHIVYKPNQRSKGFQWFLSFYLKLKAEAGETNVILIDEPGLYLHAKAQSNVLSILEKISKKSQVILSTHSPYLIDADRLDRIKLVLKGTDGTEIKNKPHKGADNETLTPIITAMGLDLSNDFSNLGKHNILVEGISDYYFLQGLKEYLGIANINETKLIPCVGATKIPQLASLLIGWGLEFAVVIDNDKKGNEVAKELHEKLSVEKNKIIKVSDKVDFSMEDLFSKDDFNKYILNNEDDNKQGVSNSKFLKEQQLDKVLLAKNFFDKTKKDKTQITLSEDTKTSFRSLFGKIASVFTP